jgi:hypothetical protein
MIPPFNRPRQGEKFHKKLHDVGTASYDYIDLFGKFEHGSTLVLYQIYCIASGLALLEDEQKFKLGGVLALIKCRFHAPTC